MTETVVLKMLRFFSIAYFVFKPENPLHIWSIPSNTTTSKSGLLATQAPIVVSTYFMRVYHLYAF